MGRQVPPFLIKDSRNGASGNFDPYRTTQLFHHYSNPWKNLSAGYLKGSNDHCREFVKPVINKKLGREFPDISDGNNYITIISPTIPIII